MELTDKESNTTNMTTVEVNPTQPTSQDPHKENQGAPKTYFF